MTRMILALTMTIALLCLAQPVGAASQDEESAAEAKSDSGDKGAKKDEPADEDDDDEEDEADGPPKSAGKSESGVALRDLVHDGFVIRTPVFIPAAVVTRQTGKVSGDAIVVTLQKQFSAAVCYYALKAYVKEGLTAIPFCTVHR